jgi:hypothetical protein
MILWARGLHNDDRKDDSEYYRRDRDGDYSSAGGLRWKHLLARNHKHLAVCWVVETSTMRMTVRNQPLTKLYDGDVECLIFIMYDILGYRDIAPEARSDVKVPPTGNNIALRR